MALLLAAAMLIATATGCTEKDFAGITAVDTTKEEADDPEDTDQSQVDAEQEDKADTSDAQEEDTVPVEEAQLNGGEEKDGGSAPVSNFSAGSISIADETIRRSAEAFGISEAEMKGVCQAIGSHVTKDYLETRELDYVKLDPQSILDNVHELVEYYVESQRLVDQDLQCDEDTRVIVKAIMDGVLEYYDNDTDMLDHLVLKNWDTFASLLRNLDVSAE